MFTLLSKLFRNKYILSLLSNGSNAIVGMLTLTLLFRSLSLDAMGEYGFFLTVLLFFDTFRSGFLSTAFINFYAGRSERKQAETAGSAWVLATAITSLFLGLNGIALVWADRVADTGIRLFLHYFGIIYTLSLPFFMANCVLQAKQRFDKLLLLNLTNQGSLLLFITTAIVTKKIDLYVVIYCYMAANLLASLVALVAGWTLIGKFKMATKETIRSLFNFGKFSVGTSITATLMTLLGTFIVKFLLGPAALAIYNAGTKLIQIVELPLRSVVFAAMPAMSERYSQGDKPGVITMMKRYTAVFSAALLPVCILTILFADYAILLLAGSKYVATEAPNILRIYMAITLIFPAERFAALTIDVFHLPKINFQKVMIMVFVGSLVSFVAVYLSDSIYAVTLSSAVSTLIGLVFGLVALGRHGYPIRFSEVVSTGKAEIIRLAQLAAHQLRVKKGQ